MELLFKLMEASGVSGSEENVREIIKEEIKPFVDEVFVDKMGNLIAHKKGKRPKVMLAAHMDEIGLMVKGITSEGKLMVSELGGIEVISITGQRVRIKAKSGIIHGIISFKELSNDHKINGIPEMYELFVDTGLSKKELEELGVGPGDTLELTQQNGYLGNENVIFGKALDDRIGCFILIELAKKLKSHQNEIFYAFTVQEELGLYGAKTSAYEIEPDWAIVVDVTNANDSAETPTKRIGCGPCITAKDSDLIGNKCINGWIKEIAKKHKIPLQVEVASFGTTDALAISLSKEGVPASVITVPIRNLHTTVGIAHKRDIMQSIELLHELLHDPPKICLV
ncbi:MAG: M28 family peptidase [Candidatus Diapherotrites archaeon]